MKKEVKFILFALLLILLIFVLNRVIKSDRITYKIKYDKTSIKIEQLKTKDNYYLNIKTPNFSYPLIIENVKSKSSKIVKNIYYFKNETYECIYPIIETKGVYDIICSNENTIYNYHTIKGKNQDLDNFVNSIKEYNIDKFSNNTDKTNSIAGIKWYINNKLNNNIYITTYNGLVSIDKETKIFDKDIYDNKISTFTDNYYLIADYNQTYEFNTFYVINLKNQEITTLKSKYDISFDSYIQGVIDNVIYLYDIDNETQYGIDINKEKISIISTSEYVKYYSNSKWQKISKSKANKELLFDYTTLDNDFSSYDKVVKTNNYYYLFKQNSNEYDLYRVCNKDLDRVYYIEKVPTLDITIYDNYIYYIYKNKLYYYSDEVGLKTILEDKELEFNNTIKYYVY